MLQNSTDEEVISRLEKKSNKILRWGIVFLVVAVVNIIFLPLAITNWTWLSLTVEKPNEIGDTIGGIMGPAVAIIAALLTFIAFWAQYEANVEQRKQFLLNQKSQHDEAKIQESRFLDAQKRISKEQFENKYYNLLDIHRQNTRELVIYNYTGAAAFYPLVQELKAAYEILNYHYLLFENIAENPNNYTKEELYQLAYLIVFFGINPDERSLFNELLTSRLKQIYDEQKDDFEVGESLEYEDSHNEKYKFWVKFQYPLFKGHSSSLSHYVRHLFQIVKFVDDQPSDLLSDEEKYNYITNLRAQLTSHEQLFIYYNALSVLGFPWLGKSSSNSVNYLEKYCIVKSLPLPLCDFYKHPLEDQVLPEYNSQGKPMFEWIEIKERLSNLN